MLNCKPKPQTSNLPFEHFSHFFLRSGYKACAYRKWILGAIALAIATSPAAAREEVLGRSGEWIVSKDGTACYMRSRAYHDGTELMFQRVKGTTSVQLILENSTWTSLGAGSIPVSLRVNNEVLPDRMSETYISGPKVVITFINKEAFVLRTQGYRLEAYYESFMLAAFWLDEEAKYGLYQLERCNGSAFDPFSK